MIATSDMVTFANDRMRVRFDRFDPRSYGVFLKTKRLPEYAIEFDPETEAYTIDAPARFADMIGVQKPKDPARRLKLSSFLLDDQRAIVPMALEAKRFAYWAGCGNGKTVVGLEFARHVHHRTQGRVLIVTLNEIVPQWIEEAKRFYGKKLRILRLKNRAQMREWCEHGDGKHHFAIANYEKFNPDEQGQVVNECRHLACVVLDESSRLKASGGKQKWALIKSFKGVEYKLSLTATPAPNDVMEFASQASFLETIRSETEILWTYFTRDPVSHRWSVKPHARAAFFEFMSSWSIYVNDPKRYGWRMNLPDVPKPTYHTIEVEPTNEQLALIPELTQTGDGQGDLYPDRTNAIQRVKLSQVAKGFRYGKNERGRRTIEIIPSNKPAAVCDIVRKEAARGAQVLVWTVFDEETAILAEMLKDVPGCQVLTGKTKPKDRVDILDRFRRGESPELISRAAMLGFGMNFQCCTAMVFSGWSDSFESLFQAIHRAVRFGQTESVRIYFPLIETLEGDTLTNIWRKFAEFERGIEEMETNYVRTTRKLKGFEACQSN